MTPLIAYITLCIKFIVKTYHMATFSQIAIGDKC